MSAIKLNGDKTWSVKNWLMILLFLLPFISALLTIGIAWGGVKTDQKNTAQWIEKHETTTEKTDEKLQTLLVSVSRLEVKVNSLLDK